MKHILSDPPFIPSYFGFDVDINKNGAEILEKNLGAIPFLLGVSKLEDDILVVDTRDESEFKKGHVPNAINIMARHENDKIETWLGAIVQPKEAFYLVIDSVKNRREILERVSKIGYEQQIKAVLTLSQTSKKASNTLDFDAFKKHPENYTIIDIRNKSEFKDVRFFEDAINLPLHELRHRIAEIPTKKPIVVHCAGGYRSAAGSSIIAKELKEHTVLDLSDKINEFK